MKDLKLVVFDWDGTLVDSVTHIVDCIEQACMDTGVAFPGSDAARNIIGLGLTEAIRELFGPLQGAQHDLFTQAYANRFMGRKTTPDDFFPGAFDLLEALRGRGLALAVATGKSWRGMSRALSDLGMEQAFDAVKCADQVSSKPDPGMLLALRDDFRLQPEQMVMIGETAWDLEMARRAGVPGIGVSWGAHPVERLLASHPRTVVNDFQALSQALGLS